jgi:hypothetical protein
MTSLAFFDVVLLYSDTVWTRRKIAKFLYHESFKSHMGGICLSNISLIYSTKE